MKTKYSIPTSNAMSTLLTWNTRSPFYLESGRVLPNLEIGFHTFGTLNEDGSNVVWVCHALTANSDPTEWWEGLVGEDCVIDPARHFIVCANIIGSCYGTTNPLSPMPAQDHPYRSILFSNLAGSCSGGFYQGMFQPKTDTGLYSAFPLITIRDMVNAHILLARHLGVQRIKLLIGGSLGGMQALEWSIFQPDFVERLVLIATNAVHSSYGIAFNESQRLSVFADPTYYENKPNGGLAGLKAARSVALLSYRTYQAFNETQIESDTDKVTDFKVAGYQNYQGDKLVKRFNAYSYVSLTHSMDSHNVGRHRGGVKIALEKIKAKTLCVAIDSDVLFPPSEQLFLWEHIPNSRMANIDSFYGHDGFLLETEALTALIERNFPEIAFE